MNLFAVDLLYGIIIFKSSDVYELGSLLRWDSRYIFGLMQCQIKYLVDFHLNRD